MDKNNNDDNQEPERYPRDEEERLNYHWGADDTIVIIIKRRDNSPSSTPEEPVTTQEPGAYPAISVQHFRDGPIEEIAVRYVRINRVLKNKAVRNEKQEDNVRAAELDFILDLETLIKEAAVDPDLIELQCCIEDDNLNQAREEYKPIIKRLTHR